MQDQEELSNLRKLNPPESVTEVEHEVNNESVEEHKHDDHKHGENCKHGSGRKKGGGKRGKNWGIIIYCVFTCLSCLYLQTQCFYPLRQDFAERRILTFVSYLIVTMCLLSYYRTITNDNFLPKVKGTPAIYDIRLYVQKNYLSKECEHCKYIKPPRVSHCSSCAGCIMKLDHHCFWTQNCIGYRNQRSFILFVFYMTFGVFQFWTATYTVFHQIYGQCKFFTYFEPGVYILWLITSFSALFVGFMIVALAISHGMYILTNHTTLMSMKANKVCPCPFCECRDNVFDNESLNPYDRGQIQNVKNLFGTNLLLAAFPFIRQIEHDFVFQTPNPDPTPLQAAKFTGEYEAEGLREQELLGSLNSLGQLFKGNKFLINGEVRTV